MYGKEMNLSSEPGIEPRRRMKGAGPQPLFRPRKIVIPPSGKPAPVDFGNRVDTGPFQ